MYTPSPSRGSQRFEVLESCLVVFGESAAGMPAGGGFGRLDCDMSSVTVL